MNKCFLWPYLKEKQSMVTKMMLILTVHVLVTLYELTCDCLLILKSGVLLFKETDVLDITIVVNVAGLRLLGIGRNQYIDLMNQCRSSKVSTSNTPSFVHRFGFVCQNPFSYRYKRRYLCL